MSAQPPNGPPQFIAGLKMWTSEIWATLRSNDIDDVLSFDTPSVIRVRDRYLGGIYHSLNFLIFLYIVVYQIIIRKGYLLTESPQGGNVRVTVTPPSVLNTKALPYCKNPNFECIHSSLGLNSDKSFPFIPTSYIVQKVPFLFPNCQEPSTLAKSLGCMYPNPNVSILEVNYFLTQAEDYGITITHTVAGLLSKYTQRSDDMRGELRTAADEPLQTFENNKPPEHYLIPVRNLLQAANVELDSETGLIAEDVRKNGIFLLVYIEYSPSNYQSASRFKMTVNRLGGESSRPSETYFSNPFPIFENGKRQKDSDEHYTVIKMSGITLQVRQVGKIGTFNLQTLLINLVAGSALLRLATFLVEILMIRFMPQRDVYCKYKYHETLDFGDYRKARKRGCEAHEMAIQKPAFHSDFPVLESPPHNDSNSPSSSKRFTN